MSRVSVLAVGVTLGADATPCGCSRCTSLPCRQICTDDVSMCAACCACCAISHTKHKRRDPFTDASNGGWAGGFIGRFKSELTDDGFNDRFADGFDSRRPQYHSTGSADRFSDGLDDGLNDRLRDDRDAGGDIGRRAVVFNDDFNRRFADDVAIRLNDGPVGRRAEYVFNDDVTGRLADDVAGRLASDVNGRLADDVTGRQVDDITIRLIDDVTDRLVDDVIARLAVDVRHRPVRLPGRRRQKGDSVYGRLFRRELANLRDVLRLAERNAAPLD